MTSSSPSSNLKTQLGRSSSLLDALDAVSKWQPSVMLTSTAVLSMLLAMLFAAVTTFFAQRSGVLAGVTGFIGFVLVMSIAVIGINATGIWLSDEVWGRKQRGIMDAVIAAVFSVHRLIAVILLEFLLFLAFLLVLTLVLFLCKLPGIGPLLYAVAMPVGVIATGIVLFGLIYIAMPLASPAIWNGTPIMRTVIMLQAVARTRMLKAIIMMVLLGILTMLVVGFVWAVLGAGALVVGSLSALVLSVSGGGIENIANMFMHGGGNGYAYAMGFGAAVLLLIGANPGILIALKGASIIYRDVSDGLALDDAERAMNDRMADIKARAEAARKQAMAHNQQSEQTTPTSPTTAATPSAAATSSAVCPSCSNAITPDDLFCGNCGHKLK